ncbi:hypothetical protein [Microbacterium radiodurans]|uniref:Uncharacterized protein n=1 Tax=Microbacterium radiodurans TaxID=661398 RepID=A0A5J5IRH3_9MICO|nr:hypothetical protein [Microbacterium radiodurans]KAA9084974.1 hypothetical protein F6B42_10680 [Microbacterium radiodurans]
MSDVEIYYHALTSAADAIQMRVSDAIMDNADIQGDDTGVENPAHRVALRLEMNRRLSGLHRAVLDRTTAASEVAASLSAIATRYSDLDVELTGTEQP